VSPALVVTAGWPDSLVLAPWEITGIMHGMAGPKRPRGVPDLDLLREAPEVYYERHRRAIEDGDFQARVIASWGLTARGAVSLPFLARMLGSPSADVREDAAGAYGWLAMNDQAVVDELLLALESEKDVQAQDSMIFALGELKDKRAVPALARMLHNEAIDGDTRSHDMWVIRG